MISGNQCEESHQKISDENGNSYYIAQEVKLGGAATSYGHPYLRKMSPIFSAYTNPKLEHAEEKDTMNEQSNEITIKIDPSIDLEDYEPTEYRNVSYGEKYITLGRVARWGASSDSIDNYMVLKKKPWVPKLGEEYFCIYVYDVVKAKRNDDTFDRERLKVGNYFKTRELGQAAFDLAMSAPKE